MSKWFSEGDQRFREQALARGFDPDDSGPQGDVFTKAFEREAALRVGLVPPSRWETIQAKLRFKWRMLKERWRYRNTCPHCGRDR